MIACRMNALESQFYQIAQADVMRCPHCVHHLRCDGTSHHLHPSNHHGTDLHGNRNRVRALLVCMPSTLGLCTFAKSGNQILFTNVLFSERVHVLLVGLHNGRVSVVLFEFSYSRGNSVLAVLNLAPMGVRHGNEKVSCCLPVRGDVAHVDEVLPCRICRAEIDHSTFVDQANLVEEPVERLSCLVNRDDGRQPADIRRDSQRANVFDSGRRVKSTGRAGKVYESCFSWVLKLTQTCLLVPRGHKTPRRQRLADRHPFLLSTRDPSQRGITNR
jgi:hypothetical protein